MSLSTDSLHAAAQWYATLLDEHATERDRAHWRDWLAQDEQNQRAWSEIEAIGAQLQPLHTERLLGQAASTALQRSHKTTHTRRHTLRALMLLSGTALASWAGWQYPPMRRMVLAQLADETSAVGQVRALELADGSHLWLHSASAVDFAIESTQRLLTLREGEVLIDTAPAPSRPFFVQTVHGRLQALGTRFTVAQTPTHTTLTVFEGRVRVQTHASTASACSQGCAIVEPGERLTFDAQQLQRPQAAAPEDSATAWTRGVLVANGLPLGQLAHELERFRHGRIQVDARVADLQVLGTYPLHDTDLALELMAQSLPIRVRRPLPWWVSIGPQ